MPMNVTTVTFGDVVTEQVPSPIPGGTGFHPADVGHVATGVAKPQGMGGPRASAGNWRNPAAVAAG
jgi:hypothetical protein